MNELSEQRLSGAQWRGRAGAAPCSLLHIVVVARVSSETVKSQICAEENTAAWVLGGSGRLEGVCSAYQPCVSGYPVPAVRVRGAWCQPPCTVRCQLHQQGNMEPGQQQQQQQAPPCYPGYEEQSDQGYQLDPFLHMPGPQSDYPAYPAYPTHHFPAPYIKPEPSEPVHPSTHTFGDPSLAYFQHLVLHHLEYAGEYQDAEQFKLERKRERNRIAATKCR